MKLFSLAPLVLLCASSGIHAQGWVRLTNTALVASSSNTVCAPNNFSGAPPNSNFRDNCFYIVDAWSGAVADTVHNRLLIQGGGHSATPDNSIFALDLSTVSATVATQCNGITPNRCSTNTTVPTMTRLNDPSPWTDCTTGANADGSPWAGHSEGALVYFPGVNKVTNSWRGGCYSSGGPETKLELFNLTASTWSGSLNPTWVGGGGSGDIGTYAHCVLDPTQTDESMFCLGGTDGGGNPRIAFRYNTVTNTVTETITATSGWPTYPNVAIDADHGIFYFVGADSYYGPSGKMYTIDLSAPTAATEITSSLVGCGDLLNASSPGFVWDSSLHRLVGFVPKKVYASASSVTIPTSFPATVTLTVATGAPFSVGAIVDVEEQSAVASTYMLGTVGSYNSGTGVLAVTVTSTPSVNGSGGGSTGGSGTHADWWVNVQFNEIIVLDPATKTCTIDPNSGSGHPLPDYAQIALDRGPNGRFSYFPAINKYAAVLSAFDDAGTFQFSGGSAMGGNAKMGGNSAIH